MDKTRILLIDDDPVTNVVTKKMLLKIASDLQISIVTDGQEAINYLQEHKTPQLILLDINMSGMDGYEFLANFNTLNLTSRIIVLTALSLDEVHHNRLKSLGCHEIIKKPITRKKFEKQMQKGFSNRVQ